MIYLSVAIFIVAPSLSSLKVAVTTCGSFAVLLAGAQRTLPQVFTRIHMYPIGAGIDCKFGS